MRALWAAYGTERRPDHAALVNALAHWSPADVASERAASAHSVTPDATLSSARELADAVVATPAGIA